MKLSQLSIVTLVAVAALAAGLSAAPSATPSAARALAVTSANSPLGRILVDGRGRTLYLFDKDKRGCSSCTGACTAYWPPLPAHGKPVAGGAARQRLLGITRRANGTRQITYAGHPLYRFALDTRAGQTNGQNLRDVGAGWHVVSPAGKKIERAGR